MFAGHIGAALALGRAERGIPLGVMVSAALLLDLLLWGFILAGWESASLPADLAITHQPEFVFPYSHGLVAALVWSAMAGGAVLAWGRGWGASRGRAAVLVALAVGSHWILDALVHVAELPVAGGNSPKVGLGLWRHLPWALGVESVLTLGGLWLYLSGSPLSTVRKSWLAVLCLSVLAFTVLGMTVSPPPPSVKTMAASSLVAIAGVSALAGWIGGCGSGRGRGSIQPVST
jgi:hypothetical protein